MFGAAALPSVVSDLESFSKTEEALMDSCSSLSWLEQKVMNWLSCFLDQW